MNHCIYITLWDNESRLIWANGFGHGYTPDSALGVRAWEFSTEPEERNRIRAAFAAVLAHSETAEYISRPGGSGAHFHCQVFPVRCEPDGSVVRACGLAMPLAGADVSPREAEVLKLLGQGKEPKLVAAALSVSHSTVQTHIASLRNKLGMGSLTELVAYAARVLVGQSLPEHEMPRGG